MTTFNTALQNIAAARSCAAVNAARAEIDRQAAAGMIDTAAAQALDKVASLRAIELAEAGEQPEERVPARAKPVASGDRHLATITVAEAVEYPHSGPLVRGTVAVFTNGVEQLVKFRIPRSWDASIRALFTAAGLPEDADAEQLVGKVVAVTLGEFQGRDGEPRSTVKRWYRPAPATRTAMLDPPREVAALPHPAPKPAGPAWERDEAAVARSPRRTPSQKAAAEFKANDTDGDDIPF